MRSYGHTAQEDAVCFFQCFTSMEKELAEEKTKSAQAKDRDASIIINAMDKMLTGKANADWLTILNTVGQETDNVDNTGQMKTTYEVYKKLVSKYICTKLYSEPGIYDLQVRYMQG